MKALRRQLVTEDEFLSLPESMQKVELLDGEVILSPAATWWHQEVLGRLYVRLRNWASTSETGPSIGVSPVDIRFGSGRILQPDAFVVLDRIPRTQKGPLDRIPEICIEVLSTDRVYDRVTKRLIYALAGVQELWVVEPNGLIERWFGPGLAQSEELREELRSPLLPGFALNILELFRDP